MAAHQLLRLSEPANLQTVKELVESYDLQARLPMGRWPDLTINLVWPDSFCGPFIPHDQGVAIR